MRRTYGSGFSLMVIIVCKEELNCKTIAAMETEPWNERGKNAATSNKAGNQKRIILNIQE